MPSTTKLAYSIKQKWTDGVGEIEDEDWGKILETPKLVSPKLSDRLIQTYITHRAYLTPQRLAKFFPTRSNRCPRCLISVGTFGHILWQCPRIQGYWSRIVQFLHDQMGSPVSLDPKQCLLGLFPEDEIWSHFVHETMFIVRKIIARNWIQVAAPTLSAWLAEINNSLPYKKVVYMNRGCPAKYNKIQ